MNHHTKQLWATFALFILLNLGLYLFILKFHNKVTFNQQDYLANAHHYLPDPRNSNSGFNLLRALGQYDAQWYLKIAADGYPKNPKNINQNDKNVMEGLTYAFFPLYPILLRTANVFFGNIELTAFVTANFLLVANSWAVLWLVAKIYSTKTAIKTSLLLFLFPLSIFFRSYFAEGLFLFLLVWFAYFLNQKKFLQAAFFLSLLVITRSSGLFLTIPFLYFLWHQLRIKELQFEKALTAFIISIIPLFGWLAFCFKQTGNPFYFYAVRSAWFQQDFPFAPLWHNLLLIIQFTRLPFHYFHTSAVDILVIFLSLCLVAKSQQFLTKSLWLISLVLAITPLIVTDTMGYTRYQIVSFPLFIYLANSLKSWLYWLVIVGFTAGLFIVSLYFVNWYWIG